MKKCLLLFLSCLVFYAVSAQNWQWIKRIDTNSSAIGSVTSINDDLFSIVYAGEDSIHFSNSSVVLSPMKTHLVKTDSLGIAKWSKELSNPIAPFFAHSSNNLFLSGYYHQSMQIANLSINSGNKATNFFLACFDTLGNVQWLKNIGDTCYDISNDIAVDNDGNVYLTGEISYGCNPNVNPIKKSFLLKYNLSGQLIMNKELDRSISYMKVNVGSDKSIYLAGSFHDSVKFSDSINDFSFYENQAGFLMKMDSSTVINWIKIFSKQNTSFVVTSKPISDYNQNVYIPIWSQENYECDGYTFNHPSIIKFNAAGAVTKIATFPAKNSIRIKLMRDYKIGFLSFDSISQSLLKLDSNLNVSYSGEIISRHYWGGRNSFFDSDSHGNFLIAGYAEDSLFFSNSELIIPRLNNYESQSFYARFISGSFVGINDSEIIQTNELKVFPNPAMNFTFEYRNPTNQNVRTIIYSSIGKEVFKKDYPAFSGELKDVIDLSKMPKGIYLLELSSGEKKQTKRLIVN
jgi:hypothetical protein